MVNIEDAYRCYPDAAAVDAWADSLLYKASNISVQGDFLDIVPVREEFGNNPNSLVNRYVRFSSSGRRTFYGYWQPSMKTPAPLLINLPGYGSYMSFHPQINDDGYNILHISPLGYVTPTGCHRDMALPDGNWPVAYNTSLGLPEGYEEWLTDCLAAIFWAQKRPEVLADRLSLFGTSQGGGGAILIASILQNNVRCVCADLPFMTAFPDTRLKGPAYGILQFSYDKCTDDESRSLFWKRLGYVDTLSHSHRLHIPVMLSAGGEDDTCPACCIEKLFGRISCTKQYTYLQNGIHTHSRESMYLFRSWLSLFA